MTIPYHHVNITVNNKKKAKKYIYLTKQGYLDLEPEP